jgi:hypothetical protein
VKRTDSEAGGILTIFKEDGDYNGFDWDGCSSLLKEDDTPTDALQEILDIFADEY